MAYVSNKLSSLLASLMSETNEEHKDEAGLTSRGKDLVFALEITLSIVDSVLNEKGEVYIKNLPETWSQFMQVLEILVSESESNKHMRQQFHGVLKYRTDALCSLLTCFATKDHQQWVCKLKEFTNYEVRDRFSKFMFPVVKQESSEELGIEILGSNILEDSFFKVMRKEPIRFIGRLSLNFEDQEAVGEGVLRQWLYLVSNELVDPNRKLFVLSPDDLRRISPNPGAAEKHLEYFRFAGRIVGLSLKHNIQTGILFDPIFFKILSGTAVFWEDLRKRDYETYMSYRRLSEIDSEEFDKNKGYGLVFSVDVTDKSGATRVHALCSDGESVVVTSRNRERFLELKFTHEYVTAVRDQTLSFCRGFNDMLSEENNSTFFFSSIHLNDLDYMLRGAEDDNICTEQWKAHTSYLGFEEKDDVIQWFWQVVREMDNDQRRRSLTIRNSSKTTARYPKSSTCMYQLTLPIYDTYEITEEKVLFITSKEVSAIFDRL